MLVKLGWKDAESVTIKAELIKEAIGKSRHIVDLSTPDLSSNIPATTSKNKGEIQ